MKSSRIKNGPGPSAVLYPPIDFIKPFACFALAITMFSELSVFPLLALLALAQDPKIHLTTLNHTGNRCADQSSLSTAVVSSQTVLQQFLPSFRPFSGPNIPISETRSNCTVYLDVGFSDSGNRLLVNPRGMDIAGYMPLSKGERTTFVASYEWVGAGTKVYPTTPAHNEDGRRFGANAFCTQASNMLTLDGPVMGQFTKHFGDETSGNSAVSPCNGGTLKVTYQARMASSSTSAGQFPVDDPLMEGWTFATSLALAKC